MGIERSVPPEFGGELFRRMRESVEIGDVPETPADEDKLIIDAAWENNLKKTMNTGTSAMAEWEKEKEKKEDEQAKR